jgi:hypothetical protein
MALAAARRTYRTANKYAMRNARYSAMPGVSEGLWLRGTRCAGRRETGWQVRTGISAVALPAGVVAAADRTT